MFFLLFRFCEPFLEHEGRDYFGLGKVGDLVLLLIFFMENHIFIINVYLVI